MISVSDNGVGMSSDIREHIFDPFFTTKEVGQGTGLGLAMVHGIVQQHDGVIEVLSEPGVGSTFNIYLPKTNSQGAIGVIPLVGDNPGGSETILVAEDEGEVLKMLSQTLKSKGYRVLAAKDGEEAISVFKANANRIELVLLDMVMPKLRGRNVYEQIRDSGSNVPVVFSTGYSPESSDAKFASETGLRTIHKPYSSEVLLKAVREVLDQ
jgi:polar amino acid transport system substrate-binding protein